VLGISKFRNKGVCPFVLFFVGVTEFVVSVENWIFGAFLDKNHHNSAA